MSALDPLIAISRRYGGDPAFVLAGGGNTSFKRGDRLWVKASGHALATIDERGFVELDRVKLETMLTGDWPMDPVQREAAFVAAVMDARVHPELNQRPSVEALLHHLLPASIVVHTHPGLVNAVTCCTRGRELIEQWFGGRVLWQPYVDPGLVLAKALSESLILRWQNTGTQPQAILLANHGLIVSGETADEIENVTAELVAPVKKQLDPALAPVPPETSKAAAILQTYANAVSKVYPEIIPAADASLAVRSLVSTRADSETALSGPLTPDQIVYCRSVPLWIESPSADIGQAARDWQEQYAGYTARHSVEPWVALLEGVGLIALRTSKALSEITCAVYADAAAVYRDARRLGGVNLLDARDRRFIEEWEVEAYRRSVMK